MLAAMLSEIEMCGLDTELTSRSSDWSAAVCWQDSVQSQRLFLISGFNFIKFLGSTQPKSSKDQCVRFRGVD